jgi:hypothetical protein
VAERNREWFSTMVRLAILIEGTGLVDYNDVVYVFGAGGFDEAFSRAISLGSGDEREYRNEDGRLVRWRLAEVLTLDQIGPGDLDGAEVWSQLKPVPAGEHADFEHVFDAATSSPGQTGVPVRGA